MAKIDISDGDAGATPFPCDHHVEVSGPAASFQVIAAEPTALGLWRHELDAGGSIRLDRAGADHVFYVSSGAVRVGDAVASIGGVVCVGHGAAAVLDASDQGAVLIHYLGGSRAERAKAGGCLHILSEKGLLTADDPVHRMSQTLYADGRCPTCSVWLHKTGMAPGEQVPPHCHTEDEIISVLEGDLLLGTRALGPGGAVAVPQQAFYSFFAGPGGLVFLNFREREALTELKVSKSGQLISERDYMYSLV